MSLRGLVLAWLCAVSVLSQSFDLPPLTLVGNKDPTQVQPAQNLTRNEALVDVLNQVPNMQYYFGVPTDGDIVIDSAMGNYTMLHDMFWRSVVINGSGVLQTNGYRVWTYLLDLSGAGTGAVVTIPSLDGLSANGNEAPSYITPTILPRTAPAGKSGGSTTMRQSGGVGYTFSVSPSIIINGGKTGPNGAAGASTQASGVQTVPPPPVRIPINRFQDTMITSSGDLMFAGQGGIVGAYAGGANGAGGGAGGWGGGGGWGIWISAKTVIKPTVYTPGVIQSNGGNAGNGGTGNVPPNPAQRTGGGGGGSGGGGGWVYIHTMDVQGANGTLGFQLNGGAGGNGGFGSGTNPQAGGGGWSGGGGRLTLVNALANTVQVVEGSEPLAGTVAVGNTPGVGAPLNVYAFEI